jgi:hypothetical protein
MSFRLPIPLRRTRWRRELVLIGDRSDQVMREGAFVELDFYHFWNNLRECGASSYLLSLVLNG